MNYLAAAAVFLIQEVIGLILFPILNKHLGPENIKAWDTKAILKGILERLVLVTALVYGYPQMLIAFGALKLGTRLHDDKGSEISNSYFLIGNLLSIFLSMISSIIIKAIWQS